MKYGRLQQIFNEEEPEFDLIETTYGDVDHYAYRQEVTSIIYHKKTDTYFGVEYWDGTSDHGIGPEEFEDFELYEVEEVVITTTVWRAKE